jgi:hypothetical protein
MPERGLRASGFESQNWQPAALFAGKFISMREYINAISQGVSFHKGHPFYICAFIKRKNARFRGLRLQIAA